MPYNPPTMAGLIRNHLEVKSDGTVFIDDKRVGWIDSASLAPVYEYRMRSNGEDQSITLRLDLTIVPEKPEPRGVYDLTGTLIGYMRQDGRVDFLDQYEQRKPCVCGPDRPCAAHDLEHDHPGG